MQTTGAAEQLAQSLLRLRPPSPPDDDELIEVV